MQPHPGPHGAVRIVTPKRPADIQDGSGLFDDEEPQPRTVRRTERRLIVEADGGSRGNPGPAAYGALVRDAVTGETLMAEGSGLIAGLQMAREVDPDAPVEVRMDSKLVIEQMAGRWKIKHPDMKPLALQAARLRPAAVTWTWIPREHNKAADTLVNRALDGDPVPRQHPV